MLASAPTDGWRRNNHIKLATATDVATVEENTARNAPIPRRYLSASTARPTPKRTPSGTVISANLIVTSERVLELDAAEQVDVLVEPVRHAVVAEVVAALLAEEHRPAERVDDEDAEDDRRRCEHRHREREVRPASS